MKMGLRKLRDNMHKIEAKETPGAWQLGKREG